VYLARTMVSMFLSPSVDQCIHLCLHLLETSPISLSTKNVTALRDVWNRGVLKMLEEKPSLSFCVYC